MFFNSDVTSNEVIGTHFIDLHEISNEGQKNKGGIVFNPEYKEFVLETCF